MSEDDVTILDDVIVAYVRKKPGFTRVAVHSRVYYYQGNFFYAISPQPDQLGRIRGAIRKFRKENRELVDKDRAHPDYRSIPQLLDEQFGEVA